MGSDFLSLFADLFPEGRVFLLEDVVSPVGCTLPFGGFLLEGFAFGLEGAVSPIGGALQFSVPELCRLLIGSKLLCQCVIPAFCFLSIGSKFFCLRGVRRL